MEQVRSTLDKVLSLLQDPTLKSDDGKAADRRRQLRELIVGRFDFTEMAKRSLGQYWRHRTADEQAEYVKLFTGFQEDVYARKIESYNGDKILYMSEALDGDTAQVDTKIVTKKGEEFAIDYRLQLTGGAWRVYDVVIENTSLVNNYRSQFTRILAGAPFDELLKRLRGRRAKEVTAERLRMDPFVTYSILSAGFPIRPR